MGSTERPVVLITGCSTGLGFCLSQVLQQTNKFRLVLTAREKSLGILQECFTEDENLMIRRLDVTSAKQRTEIVSEIYSKWKRIDVLINNAGICFRSVIEHMDDDSEMLQLQTNYLGPIALLRLVIPSMRERGHGQIINISSVSGIIAMPTMASYSASKHALEGASEALWYELKPFGISVSVVQPGFIRSNSFRNVLMSRKAQLSLDLDGPYADFYKSMSPFVEWVMNRSTVTPQHIAQNILKLILSKNPSLWVPATPDAILLFYLRKLLPRRLFHGIMYRLLPNSKNWAERYSKLNPSNSSIKTPEQWI